MSNSDSRVMRFNTDGTVQALWHPEIDSGAIDLRALGPCQIERLSHVEPNNETGEWEVRDREGTLLLSCPTRQAALDGEVEWFQSALKGNRTTPFLSTEIGLKKS